MLPARISKTVFLELHWLNTSSGERWPSVQLRQPSAASETQTNDSCWPFLNLTSRDATVVRPFNTLSTTKHLFTAHARRFVASSAELGDLVAILSIRKLGIVSRQRAREAGGTRQIVLLCVLVTSTGCQDDGCQDASVFDSRSRPPPFLKTLRHRLGIDLFRLWRSGRVF